MCETYLGEIWCSEVSPEDPRLVNSSSPGRILLGESTSPFIAFLLDPSKFLLAGTTFAYMLIQLPIILSLFLRMDILIGFIPGSTWAYSYSESLTKGVILKASLGVIGYIKSLI